MRLCRRFSWLPADRHCEERSSGAIQATFLMMDCFASLAMTIEVLPQMLLEKLRRPAPGKLGGLAIMHGRALFVHEGMLGVVAEQLERFAGGLHRLLEGVDSSRRAPVVL